MEDLHQMFAYAAELEQGFEAVEWNRHERLVVIGGIVLAHDGDEDLNLPALEAAWWFMLNSRPPSVLQTASNQS